MNTAPAGGHARFRLKPLYWQVKETPVFDAPEHENVLVPEHTLYWAFTASQSEQPNAGTHFAPPKSEHACFDTSHLSPPVPQANIPAQVEPELPLEEEDEPPLDEPPLDEPPDEEDDDVVVHAPSWLTFASAPHANF